MFSNNLCVTYLGKHKIDAERNSIYQIIKNRTALSFSPDCLMIANILYIFGISGAVPTYILAIAICNVYFAVYKYIGQYIGHILYVCMYMCIYILTHISIYIYVYKDLALTWGCIIMNDASQDTMQLKGLEYCSASHTHIFFHRMA